jgi:hypothetical protein
MVLIPEGTTHVDLREFCRVADKMDIEAKDPISWGESSCRYTHIAARSAATGSRRSRISARRLKSPVPSVAACSSDR